MPSYEEVEAAGNKPFVPPESSKLQAAPADLAKALGLADTEVEEQKPSEDAEKANAEAEKVIQNNSARIQKTAEELYQVEERLALTDEARLPELVDSKDPQDRKLAEKILKRNPDAFGADSIEEYRKVLVTKSTDDPTEQKLAVQDLEIQSLKQKQEESEWSEWKKANSVGPDIGAVADEIRAQYPEMSRGDILTLARGKKGIENATGQKASTSAAIGGSGVPETDDSVYSSPLARRLLRNPKSTMDFAKGYVRSLNS